jgi:hypothetical protein
VRQRPAARGSALTHSPAAGLANIGRINVDLIAQFIGEIDMVTKSATIQYRYLDKTPLWEEFHLKDMLTDILGRSASAGPRKLFEDVSARKIDLDQDGSFVVLNKISPQSEWSGPVFCGQLIHVKSGTHLPGIDGDLDQSVPELTLKNLTLAERTQLVEGVLYFAIAENHIGLIEGQRTRARTLERYLASMMQQAGELEPGVPIYLNAKLAGKVQNVQKLEIKPQRMFGRRGEKASDKTVSKSAGQEESRGKTVLDVLRALGWRDEEIYELETQVPEDGWLEGIFTLAVKMKRGRKGAVDRKSLENALRNLDPDTIGLLGGGSREKAGTIKLSESRKISLVGELMDPEAAMKEIVNMLQQWSATGRIDYDFEK